MSIIGFWSEFFLLFNISWSTRNHCDARFTSPRNTAGSAHRYKMCQFFPSEFSKERAVITGQGSQCTVSTQWLVYRLNNSGTVIQFPAGARGIFFFSKMSRFAVVPTHPHIHWAARPLCGGKEDGEWNWPSTYTVSEVTNEWWCTSTSTYALNRYPANVDNMVSSYQC